MIKITNREYPCCVDCAHGEMIVFERFKTYPDGDTHTESDWFQMCKIGKTPDVRKYPKYESPLMKWAIPSTEIAPPEIWAQKDRRTQKFDLIECPYFKKKENNE